MNQENLTTGYFKHNNYNKDENEPIYVMTIELEQGNTATINIFHNTNPEETAYEFCKANNLEFSSLGYLTDEIRNLINNLTPSIF